MSGSVIDYCAEGHSVPDGETVCARCGIDPSAPPPEVEAAAPAEEMPEDRTPIPVELTPAQALIMQRLDALTQGINMLIAHNQVTHLVLGGIMAAIHGDQPKLPAEIWRLIGCQPGEKPSDISVAPAGLASRLRRR